MKLKKICTTLSENYIIASFVISSVRVLFEFTVKVILGDVLVAIGVHDRVATVHVIVVHAAEEEEIIMAALLYVPPVDNAVELLPRVHVEHAHQGGHLQVQQKRVQTGPLNKFSGGLSVLHLEQTIMTHVGPRIQDDDYRVQNFSPINSARNERTSVIKRMQQQWAVDSSSESLLPSELELLPPTLDEDVLLFPIITKQAEYNNKPATFIPPPAKPETKEPGFTSTCLLTILTFTTGALGLLLAYVINLFGTHKTIM